MFHAEINRTLTAAVNLMNTAEGLHSAKPSPDEITSIESLRKFVAAQDPELKWPSSGLDRSQVDGIIELRDTLREIWSAAPITGGRPVEQINELLDGVSTKLVRTDETSTTPEYRAAPIPVSGQLVDVVTAAVGDALKFLLVNDETSRMRTCRGDDCDAAIIDLTRNRSKLFCDFGNCANRAHVRAYRARQAALREAGKQALKESETEDKLAKPSAAEKAAELDEPTSESGVAAKQFRSAMRDELMDQRDTKGGKKKKKKKNKK